VADESAEACPTREELIARYGKLEWADAATVLALVGQPDYPPGDAVAHRYPSVEAFEAYALANRVRNQIGKHGIMQVGPAVTDDGVFGAILLGTDTPAVADPAPGRKISERFVDDLAVEGYCPVGCGRTLFLAGGGLVTCSYVHCPRPDAVHDLLADKETAHIVVLEETTFTVRHPLHERLDDALMQCSLNGYLAGLDGPPAAPGRYRVTGEPGNLTWTEVDHG
jgi:Family of unknown function (DUF6085)